MIVAAVWSAALVGGVLGVTTLTGRDAPAPVARHVGEQFNGPQIGGRVITSFGSFSVSSVDALVGPTRAMHLDSLARGTRPIQLNLTVNNIQQRKLVYDRDWFRMVGSQGTYLIGWSSHLGTMASLSTKGLLLRVSVPVGDRLPRLEFRDPSTRARVLIDLGSARNLQTFNPTTHRHGG